MKILLILLNVLVVIMLQAQVPQAFKYQAVARNTDGSLIKNQLVAFRISILHGGSSGTIEYQESNTTTTNDFGLANLEIGKGTALIGTFNTIGWGEGQMFLKVELDPAGGTAYLDMGTSELLSVPYALHAGSDNNWINNGTGIYRNGNTAIGTVPHNDCKLIVSKTEYGANETGILGYRWGSSNELSGGNDWSVSGIDAAIKGETLWGNHHSASIAGYSYLDFPSSAAIIGSDWYGTTKGFLAFKDADEHLWAGYFSGNSSISGQLGIGTKILKGNLNINNYQGGVMGSNVSGLDHQIVLGGDYNAGPNSDGVKLWIGDYNNDGTTVYPIYCEDENNLVDFFLKNRPSESGTPQMYFAGNVGIGTDAPSSSKLQLEGAGTYNAIQRFVNTGTNGVDFFMGSNNDNWSMGGNKFVMGHGTPNSTNVDLCIESTGYLGLNLGSSTASQWLDVNGNARFRSVTSGTYSLALNLTSNGTLTTATSDERLKTNIETLQGGLDKVMNLRGVRFNWKEDAQGKQMIGFIAQEVEKVVPELVFTNPVDSYKGVNYAEMTAVLVEAVKELQAKISKLEEEIAELKNN